MVSVGTLPVGGGTASIWQSWNTVYMQTGIAGTANTVSNGTVWAYWNQAYGQTQTAASTNLVTQQTVWYAWNDSYTTGNQYVDIRQVPETAAQRATREEATTVEAERRKLAAKRARELLIASLNRQQQEQFDKEGTFELQVNDKLYRVRPGSRVERLDKKTKKVQSYFCIHPEFEYGLPHEDVALGQKLLLEAAESEFLRIANETRVA